MCWLRWRMRRAPPLYRPTSQEQKNDQHKHKLLLAGQVNHVSGLSKPHRIILAQPWPRANIQRG